MSGERDGVVGLFTSILPREGSLDAAVGGLSLFRIDHSFPRIPYSYQSEIIIMVQGRKRVRHGSRAFVYDPARYLVLPVPLPLECEGRADPGKPILGMSIAIDPVEIGGIIAELEDDPPEPRILPKGIYSAAVDEALSGATERLLRALADPRDAIVLAPMVKREILYRALTGEKGELLRSVARRNKRFFQIAKVLRLIHESYDSDLDVESLARGIEMSGSTFHSCFKAVTATSPLQYIKRVRLHEARNLMIREGLPAGQAAMRVGYESPSQFSREYKRLFGLPPAKDAGSAIGRPAGRA